MLRSLKLTVFVLLLAWSSLPGFAQDDALKKGRALQREKKYEEALQLYRDAIKTNPTEELYIESGSLLGKLQKYDNALTILEKGLQAYPDSRSLKNLTALILVRKGDKTRAKALLEEVLAADADNSFARQWLEKINRGEGADSDVADSPAATSGDNSSASVGGSGDGTYQIDGSMGEKEQEELAKQLYREMIDLEKWELDSFKALHRKVIEKCPQTGQAEESCWRLANLFLLGEDPPDYESAIGVLEHLLKQYPDSPFFPDAKNRLLIAYQKTGQNDRVVSLYEELFTRDPDPVDEKVFMVRALEFADALNAIGRSSDAQAWYQKIIERDDGKDSLEARVAKERLAGGN